MQMFQRCIDLIFPRKCIGCGSLGGYICEQCAIGAFEEKQLRFEYIGKRQGVDVGISLVTYKGLFKQIVTTAKYGNYQQVFNDLCSVMLTQGVLAKLRRHIGDLSTTGVFPVPMHIKKERLRGFNQADIIGAHISKGLSCMLCDHYVRKIKETVPQASLHAKERQTNIRGVFKVDGQYKIPDTALVVDDVWTTGATVHEVAGMLKRGGAHRVIAFTLARRWYNTHT